MEAAWFLMSEGELHGNQAAFLAAKKIIDFTMPIGWDESHGGIIAFADVMGKPCAQLEWDMKLWWPQCEAIIANALAYRYFGEEKYKRNYDMLLNYVFTYMADKECGEWYGYLHYDNSVSHTLKGNVFKGPFHLPRMLLLLSALETENGFKRYLS